jgi:DNA-directed RNA polymerase specialized sigma24 family protein
MTDTAKIIVTYLPYLRRYARALTGSQARGDEYVRVCLETILAEPTRIVADGDIRLQLFSTFHDVWTVVQQAAPDAEPADGEPRRADERIRQGLATLPPIERQVLLLVSLEGFSYEDAGYILGLEEDEVRDYFAAARNEMQRQTAAAILIIEDEQVIAMDIARIVQEMGHRIVGTASREREAIQLAERERPALVLADIQLKDGDSGIDAVHEILKRIDAPVIFVTGFPERLLTGERLEPAFVVTKPFKPETLKAAVSQALSVDPPQAFKRRAAAKR